MPPTPEPPTRSPEHGLDLHRAVVEQAQEAIICTDRSGAIRLWNAAAEALFGYRADEVMGGSLDVIIPEKLRAAHNAGFARAMETGALRNTGRVLTTRGQNKSGERLYVDMSFALLKDSAGEVVGAFAVARDVTARYLEEQARRAAAAKERQ